MRATSRVFLQTSNLRKRHVPIVQIQNGTFYRHHPTSNDFNPPLFPNLTFSLNAHTDNEEYWAIVGPSLSGKTTFLEILRGLHLCIPPRSRSFPALADPAKVETRSRDPLHAIQYVGFDTKGGDFGSQHTKGAYLSARYESRRESTDFSVLDYLTGVTELNPTNDHLANAIRLQDDEGLKSIIKRLNLQDLLSSSVSNLSNGQTRRAKVAKALVSQPHLLLLDEPFLGLDPMNRASMSPMLKTLSGGGGPCLLLAVQSLDEVPDWVTHLLYLGKDIRVQARGPKQDFVKRGGSLLATMDSVESSNGSQAHFAGSSFTSTFRSKADTSLVSRVILEESKAPTKTSSRSVAPFRWHSVDDLIPQDSNAVNDIGGPLVEMKGIKVSYGERKVLGHWEQDIDGRRKPGLWWKVRRGDRWGVFGPNGSGKTTLLSLISSDHPQTYSLPIKIFDRSRIPELGTPGISIFDIQSRIGQASPEVHNFFPRHLTIRQTLENAWADTFMSKPRLTYDVDMAVDACLRWFRLELDPGFAGPELQDSLVNRYNLQAAKTKSKQRTQAPLRDYMSTDTDWADHIFLRDVSFSAQRVALFIRAIIKKPDILILDEAFSGMDERTRIKCMLFLAYGETMWLMKNNDKNVAFVNRSKMPTMQKKYDKVTIDGLEPRQALLCVSHRQEEVPPILRQWVCLPESNSGDPARFGWLPFQRTYEWPKSYWWRDIWQQGYGNGSVA